jgi:hypothetical protein
MATDPSSSSSSSTSRTRGLRKGRSTKDLLAAYKAELAVPTAPLPPLHQPDPRQVSLRKGPQVLVMISVLIDSEIRLRLPPTV